ncbi:MAG: type IX secretion system membrane protein PorP/SprF [Flavobacteriales bacterium]|nr:type IX secretion system membrane protein PorP/SprF [Flavobacteriales bacterium]
MILIAQDSRMLDINGANAYLNPGILEEDSHQVALKSVSNLLLSREVFNYNHYFQMTRQFEKIQVSTYYLANYYRDFNFQEVGLNFTKSLKFDFGHSSFGLKTNLMEYNHGFTSTTWDDDDPVLGRYGNRAYSWLLGFGSSTKFSELTFGFSLDNAIVLLQKSDFDTLKILPAKESSHIRFSFNAGYDIFLKNVRIHPSILIQSGANTIRSYSIKLSHRHNHLSFRQENNRSIFLYERKTKNFGITSAFAVSDVQLVRVEAGVQFYFNLRR